ncbi:chromosomal replication initiator protein DnaA [Mycoplasma zalophi]|uniref:Chromosomal replication initiator protein DnaA n=1 Tax=Mycoplasma zalophi TaxID=191287 RepID=A0ABS6DPU2_9MOLU|nr:chromosomal replication initiator protein DnaA [Mycoplasma zalophi]MBU4692181.1 chromosomal replication initiator protein DnaA [Mycoplasma zalophi]
MNSTRKINPNADLEINNTLLQQEFESTSNDPILYDSFLTLVKIIKQKDNKVFLHAPDKIRVFLEANYKEYIYRCVNEIYQDAKEIIFSSDNLLYNNELKKTQTKINVQPELTFENYTKGKFNEQALLGARTVIENQQGQIAFNPLFIYASSGLGKTHLLHAIGNELIKKGKSCLYIQPNIFIRPIIEHLKNKNQEGINKIIDDCLKYDCLMFDDVQEFGGKENTLNVLFAIINNHISENKQIIISADKTPKELGGFEERFITRFSGGITFKINNPSVEDIINIFKFKIDKELIDSNKFDDKTYKFLARNFSNSIRNIQGAVNKIKIFYINDKNFRYDSEYIKSIFKDVGTVSESVTPEKIVDTVCKYYGIERKKVIDKNRSQNIVKARRVSMWLIKDLFDIPFSDIGKMFSGQTHSSVIASVNYIDKHIKSDSTLSLAISKIKDNLKKIL